jgi:single-strand DNA-binding protein
MSTAGRRGSRTGAAADRLLVSHPTAGAVEGGSAMQDGSCNEVRLVGRVSGEPEERELPSGDLLVSWRVVVDRAPPRRPAREGVRVPTIDTLDCVAWTAATRRTARSLQAGDVVEVSGALRKRFWRSGGGPASRTEIEAEVVRRLQRA